MRSRKVVIVAVVVAALGLAGPSRARADEDLSPSRGEVSFHLGVFEPRGESELWRENGRLFTQDVTEFDDLVQGLAFASRLNRIMDFVVGAEYYDSHVRTEYRDIVFDNGDAIHHRDRFRQVPIDLSIKFLPFGRTLARGPKGRRVVRPVVPYLGFGGGALLWDYREEGRFVDTTDPDDPVLFNGNFHARGITGSYHALAGVEIQINPQVALHFDGRFRWAKDRLGSDFEGFDRFDLSGGSLTLGLGFRL